jgi:hypothetical protein
MGPLMEKYQTAAGDYTEDDESEHDLGHASHGRRPYHEGKDCAVAIALNSTPAVSGPIP